jgi:hypothetical protein
MANKKDTMSNDQWLNDHSEMDEAFAYGTVSDATPEQLEKWLKTLCNGNAPNESIRHREIVRGITINHIQMSRMIRHLDESNRRTQILVIVLALAAVIVGVIQILIAIISLCK